jgi:hypothetical protein
MIPSFSSTGAPAKGIRTHVSTTTTLEGCDCTGQDPEEWLSYQFAGSSHKLRRDPIEEIRHDNATFHIRLDAYAETPCSSKDGTCCRPTRKNRDATMVQPLATKELENGYPG